MTKNRDLQFKSSTNTEFNVIRTSQKAYPREESVEESKFDEQKHYPKGHPTLLPAPVPENLFSLVEGDLREAVDERPLPVQTKSSTDQQCPQSEGQYPKNPIHQRQCFWHNPLPHKLRSLIFIQRRSE